MSETSDPDAPMPTEPGHRRRPVGWIVLSCVLALVAVGLGVWAIGAQSDADDAQTKLAAQEEAAKVATPQPTAEPTSTPTPPPASTSAPIQVDPAIQAEFEKLAKDLGATSESVDQIEQDLEQATAKVDDAEKARDSAAGVIDKAKAEAEALGARFELTRTCLRGTLSALGSAFESGGIDAAVQELQKLAGSCASVASSWSCRRPPAIAPWTIFKKARRSGSNSQMGPSARASSWARPRDRGSVVQPGAYVAYPDTRSGEEVALMRSSRATRPSNGDAG